MENSAILFRDGRDPLFDNPCISLLKLIRNSLIMSGILASYVIGKELYHYRENREEVIFLAVGFLYLKESEILEM
jgi:hypothetical protein